MMRFKKPSFAASSAPEAQSALRELTKIYGNAKAEADVIVAVKDKSSFVSINGDVTEYTLSADQTTHGKFAFSILSGTNKDYGTRCEMTDNMLWTAK